MTSLLQSGLRALIDLKGKLDLKVLLLGTPTQQQFQNYQSPTLGASIQYPSDWKLLEESNDKLRFIKQEGFVTVNN